jgi:hypothetical protein
VNAGSAVDERMERLECPMCGRPMHRWVTVRTFKAPREPEVAATWWLHDDDNTLRCEDVEYVGGTF